MVGQGLLNSSNQQLQLEDEVPIKQPAKVKDELDLAHDVNSSGLIEKGFLDEMRMNDAGEVKPSGRFQQQASIRKGDGEEAGSQERPSQVNSFQNSSQQLAGSRIFGEADQLGSGILKTPEEIQWQQMAK